MPHLYRDTMSTKKRLCEICGARVRNINPKVTTCGPICTEAKNKGRTHKHQMRLEAKRDDPRYTSQDVNDWPRGRDGEYLP